MSEAPENGGSNTLPDTSNTPETPKGPGRIRRFFGFGREFVQTVALLVLFFHLFGAKVPKLNEIPGAAYWFAGNPALVSNTSTDSTPSNSLPIPTAQQVAAALKADIHFTNSLKGEKGDRGEKGEKGDHGEKGDKGDSSDSAPAPEGLSETVEAPVVAVTEVTKGKLTIVRNDLKAWDSWAQAAVVWVSRITQKTDYQKPKLPEFEEPKSEAQAQAFLTTDSSLIQGYYTWSLRVKRFIEQESAIRSYEVPEQYQLTDAERTELRRNP